MALNQVVLPGFAAYRIGIQTSEEVEVLKDKEHVSADGDVASHTDDVSRDKASAE